MAVYSLFVVLVVAMAMMVQGVPTDTEFDQWLAAQSVRHAGQVTTTTVTPDVTVTATEPTCVRYVGDGAEYSKIKNAVKSIPDGGSERCVIYVAAGSYKLVTQVPYILSCLVLLLRTTNESKFYECVWLHF